MEEDGEQEKEQREMKEQADKLLESFPYLGECAQARKLVR